MFLKLHQFLCLLLVWLCKPGIVLEFQVVCYHGRLFGERHNSTILVETFLTENLLYAANTLSLDKVY